MNHTEAADRRLVRQTLNGRNPNWGEAAKVAAPCRCRKAEAELVNGVFQVRCGSCDELANALAPTASTVQKSKQRPNDEPLPNAGSAALQFDINSNFLFRPAHECFFLEARAATTMTALKKRATMTMPTMILGRFFLLRSCRCVTSFCGRISRRCEGISEPAGS